LVKFTELPAHCGALEVNVAVGSGLIVITCVAVAEQPDAMAVVVNVTVCAPDAEYVTPAWFCVTEVRGVAAAPKLQLYVKPAPVEPVLVKFTAAPMHWGALSLNEAVGPWLIVIDCVVVAEQPVSVFVTVSVTVTEPEVENVTPVGFCAVDVAGEAPAPKFQL